MSDLPATPGNVNAAAGAALERAMLPHPDWPALLAELRKNGEDMRRIAAVVESEQTRATLEELADHSDLMREVIRLARFTHGLTGVVPDFSHASTFLSEGGAPRFVGATAASIAAIMDTLEAGDAAEPEERSEA